MASLTYLDTNAVLWLAGAPEELSEVARNAIDAANVLMISPMVSLELDYLREVGRLTRPGSEVLAHLRGFLNLQVCQRSFSAVVEVARTLTWTRDPFDRLITAQSALGRDPLITRDHTIRAHYDLALW